MTDPLRPAADLTDRQRNVLDLIRAHIRHHGYPPSVREMTLDEALGAGKWASRAVPDAD